MVGRIWRGVQYEAASPLLARIAVGLGVVWCVAAVAIIASGREAEVRPYLLGGLGLVLGGVADLLPAARRRQAGALRLLALACLVVFLALALPIWLG